MPNPVVHFEVNGRDGEALRKFYADAFDWKINVFGPMNYGLVDAEEQGAGIGGGIGQEETPVATFYVEVDDPAAYLEKITSLGGKVVQDVTEIPGAVTLARFQDPEGNIIGLVKAT